ncbi:Transmembrane protein 18 [Dillenia turbinata]|uniref:Transmembrane protein 18 n=1 Tax=Dillenia turbinata TaxID=194707 RepID=A0AAN8VR37_9MAGN
MEELHAAMEEHMKLITDLVEESSAELRSGLQPAYENFMGFFHALNWKEPWLIGLISFHVLLLLIVFFSRKHVNFQMCLFLLSLTGVYLAKRLNTFLNEHWKSFAGQNYFDSSGLFLSVLWSGPLLVFAMIILVNTLFSLCHLIVRWKKAELRHRARLARNKQE